VTLESREVAASIEAVQASVAARFGDTPSLRIRQLHARGISARDAGGDTQAAAVALEGQASIATAGTGAPLSMTAKIAAARGELLYRRAYLDLSAFPGVLEGSVRSSDGGGFEVQRVRLDVERLVSVEASAAIDADRTLRAADAHAHVAQVTVPFDTLVRETFAETYPVLAQTRVTGTLEAHARYDRIDAERRRASGRAVLRDGTVRITDPLIDAHALSFEIPFALVWGEPGQGAASADSRERGYVRTGAVRVGGLALSPVDLPLEAHPNEITAAEPIVVPFAGGGVRVARLRLVAAPREEVRVDASVALEPMDLAALSEAARLPRVEGTLGGDLGEVTFESGDVTATGALVAEVFGGRVIVSDMGVENVTSPVPSLRLDADANGLDLRSATEAFGVGYVSGVARAEVDDLAVVAGQPVSFDATFETIPTAGVPQRVSVAAIDQLTILGGADSGPVARGILRLFDEYRYAKMGLRCRLRNDRFILQGIEQHDGKDFLVVGTLLPPTVNVISHNQVIAFSEMIERLKRITAVGEEPPVVE
jgi:hypothetical protein